MKQEYVLPKFNIPGQPNWLVRGVWLLAGVAMVSLGALGFAYWRRASALTPPVVAQAPAPGAPVTPAPPAAPVVPAKPAPASAVPKPAAPGAPATPGAARLAGKSPAGGRFGRYRGRYAKGKLGTRGHRARAGKRALLARKAYLRKKRLLAARRAKAGSPAKPSAGLAAGAGGTRRPSPAPANKSQGDPIDDILRNFK